MEGEIKIERNCNSNKNRKQINAPNIKKMILKKSVSNVK